MLHLKPAKCDKEHIGFIVFLGVIKSIPILMRENVTRKEKSLYQTGRYKFRDALGYPYQVTVITAFGQEISVWISKG